MSIFFTGIHFVLSVFDAGKQVGVRSFFSVIGKHGGDKLSLSKGKNPVNEKTGAGSMKG